MAAVALAWESQSTRRVGCSAVARQAARFTAVVVLPTPPFWFATAMIRAKYSPESENLAKLFQLERSQLRSSAMRFVCAFLDSERSGGGFPRLSLRGGQ